MRQLIYYLIVIFKRTKKIPSSRLGTIYSKMDLFTVTNQAKYCFSTHMKKTKKQKKTSELEFLKIQINYLLLVPGDNSFVSDAYSTSEKNSHFYYIL